MGSAIETASPSSSSIKESEGQRSALLAFLLKYVRQFQPFGQDIFCSRRAFLLANLVTRNLKLRYRRSFLGFFWTLALPLGMALVYYSVFRFVMRLEIENHAAFVILGVIPWALFGQTVSEGMESLVQNHGILVKIPMPLQIFPLAIASTNLVNLFFSIPVLLLVAFLSGVSPHFNFLSAPYFVFTSFLIAYSIALLMAVAYVYFRDLKHIMAVAMQVWMYATPILYPETMIPPAFKWVLFANPIATSIVGIRAAFLQARPPDPMIFLVSGLWGVGLLFLASAVIRSARRVVVENL